MIQLINTDTGWNLFFKIEYSVLFLASEGKKMEFRSPINKNFMGPYSNIKDYHIIMHNSVCTVDVTHSHICPRVTSVVIW